jgi:hypothetical protein
LGEYPVPGYAMKSTGTMKEGTAPVIPCSLSASCLMKNFLFTWYLESGEYNITVVKALKGDMEGVRGLPKPAFLGTNAIF